MKYDDGKTLRTDLAVTLFLSDQDAYDGGELVICSSLGELAVKLPAGDAAVYEASTLHRVNPVTRGTRYAAVTWVQSYVREWDKRSVLADLNEVCGYLHRESPGSQYTDLAHKTYANLLRLWVDA